jgi:hypothetical protein
MPIRLKFKAISITDVGGGAGKMVNLAPIFHDGEHDNTQHFRSNSGQMLAIGTLYPQSADQFQVGEEYWLDFTPVHGDTHEERHEDEPAQAPQPRSKQQTQDFRQPSRPTRATQTLRSAREPQRVSRQKPARSSLTTKSHRASVRR